MLKKPAEWPPSKAPWKRPGVRLGLPLPRPPPPARPAPAAPLRGRLVVRDLVKIGRGSCDMVLFMQEGGRQPTRCNDGMRCLLFAVKLEYHVLASSCRCSLAKDSVLTHNITPSHEFDCCSLLLGGLFGRRRLGRSSTEPPAVS